MAIQFITGELHQNKKQSIIEHLYKLHQANPQAQLYYIVPEHLKFDMETMLLSEIQRQIGRDEAASLNLQVVSFTRLAWFLLPSKLTREMTISSLGVHMILRQILEQLKADLYVFRGQIKYQGFIEKLADLFEELMQGNITPEDLAHSVNQLKVANAGELGQSPLQTFEVGPHPQTNIQRLSEICLIYEQYRLLIDKLELEDHKLYDDLGALLAKGSFDNYVAVIDHHYYFNAEEIQLVLNLARSFQQVYITLPIASHALTSNEWNPLTDLPHKTYNQLLSLSQQLGITINAHWEIVQHPFNYRSEILQVAEQFQQNLTHAKALQEPSTLQTAKTHHWWQFDSLQTEIRHISNQIHYLVAQENYRYSDIVVLSRDLDLYQAVIEPIFAMNDIPFFYDHQTKMNEHSFTVLLQVYLNLHKYRWKYSDVMAVLKSDLLFPFVYDESLTKESAAEWQVQQRRHRHRINLFENILLANSYFDYRLINEQFLWEFSGQQDVYYEYDGQPAQENLQELSQRLRQWIIEELASPFEIWQSELSGRQAAEWLYRLVNDLGIKGHLMRLRDLAILEGRIQESLEHEQVWEVFVQTIEEFYTLYSDSPISFTEFYDILLTGLMESNFHTIPPTLDQVTVTSMESPQVAPYKVAFVIGADEFALPRQYENQTLLGNEERQEIADHLLAHQFLLEHDQIMSHQELLLAYQLLLDAEEQLYVSFVSQGEEESKQLSPYYQQLVDVLELSVTSIDSKHHLINNQPLIASDFGKLSMQISPVLQLIRRQYESPEYVDPYLKNLIRLLTQQEAKETGQKRLIDLLPRLFTFNQLPQNLLPETAIALFGKNLSASVSKVEQYYQDPYSHFLIYGLKLKEREHFELSPAKTGDYFHEYLDYFMKYLIQKDLKLEQLSNQELQQLFQMTSQHLVQDHRFNLLSSNSRMKAIHQQMEYRLHSFIEFTRLQQQLSKLTPMHTELIFGNTLQNDIRGFDYRLDSGGKLSIRGKIDRIDTTPLTEAPAFLQVIDYKSGKTTFNLLDVYYGLDLQILTYLSVAMKNFPTFKPLGGFYQTILQPFNRFTDSLQERDDLEQRNTRLAQHRLTGFVATSADRLKSVEPTSYESNRSLIYPVRYRRDETFYASDPTFNEEEFEQLIRYVDFLFKQAGNQIQQGEISLRPFETEIYTPSLQQQFRVITGFDATESFSAYRHKTRMNRKEIFKQIHDLLQPNYEKEEGGSE